MPKKGSTIVQRVFVKAEEAKKFIDEFKFLSRPTKAFVDRFLASLIGPKNPLIFKTNQQRLSWWAGDKKTDRLGRVLLDRAHSTEALIRSNIVTKNPSLKTIAPNYRVRSDGFIGFTLDSEETAAKFASILADIIRNL
ncbi:hypothetical protein HZA44_03700 [Candidatus Peregrinibacteria bacterium]|nr:hypothetical protein [Candidatus Peregrinibacteria bacterium]